MSTIKRACLLGLVFAILLLSWTYPYTSSTTAIETHDDSVIETSHERPRLVEPRATLADTRYYYVNSLYQDTYGTFSGGISSLQADDDVRAVMHEELASGYYRFNMIFRFNCRAYKHANPILQIGGLEAWSMAAEGLELSWSDDGGSYVVFATLTSNLETQHSTAIDIDDSEFFVKLEGHIEGNPDTWCDQYWDIDYIRVEADDTIINLGVSVDKLYDIVLTGGSIYAYRGYGTNDYVDVICRAESAYSYTLVSGLGLWVFTEQEESLWFIGWDSAEGFMINPEVGGGEDYIELASSSYATHDGDYIREVHFHVKVKWDHPNEENLKILLMSVGEGSDHDLFSTSWDITTDLEFDIAPTMSKQRANSGSSVTASGLVKYLGSDYDDVAPLSSHVDIVPIRTSPTSWTGSTYGLDSEGNFAVTCTLDGSALGYNDFVIHVYQQGTTTDIVTYTMNDHVKADAIRVRSGSEGSLDPIINIGESTTIYCELEFVTDSVEVTIIHLASFKWSGVSMSWDSGQGRWEGTSSTRSTPGITTFSSMTDVVATSGISSVTNVQTHPATTVTYERVKITHHSVVDPLISIGASTTMRVKASYEYSGYSLGSGDTIWISDGTTTFELAWDGTYFSGEVTHATDGTMTYTVVSVSCSHGITALNLDGYNTQVTYDFIDITASGIIDSDGIANLGTSHIIWFTAELYHNGTTLGVGDSITTSYGAATWVTANNRFEITLSSPYNSFVNSIQITITAASETTYSITTLENSPPSVTAIWSTLLVQLWVDDSFVSTGTSVTIYARIIRAHDGSVLTNFSGDTKVVLRYPSSVDYNMEYNATEAVWTYVHSHSNVGTWSYYINEIKDGEYGLETIGKGAHFDGSNEYVDFGVVSSLDLTSNLTLSAWFRGTGSSWTDSYIVAKKNINQAQYALYMTSGGELQFLHHDGVALHSQTLRTSVTRNAWHHIIVTISDTVLNAYFDGIHVQENIMLDGPLTSYPSVPVYIGAQQSATSPSHHFNGYISEVQIYSIALSDIECELLHQGQYPATESLRLHVDTTSLDLDDGLWIDLSSLSNDGTILGADMELGALPSDESERVSIIWTKVKVASYSSDDSVINVGATASNHVYLVYAHDNDPVLDGMVLVSGLSATHNASGRWDFGEQQQDFTAITYDYVSYSGGSYGIYSVDQNSRSLEQIWDEILIQAIMTTKQYCDIGTKAEIRLIARLSYHSFHYLGLSDTLYMDESKMSYSISGGYFYYEPVQTLAGYWTYFVNSSGAYEDTYGITAINSNSQLVVVGWDGLIITLNDCPRQYLNLYENASGITISALYASDGTPYDGTIILNNTEFTYSTAGRRGYTIQSALGDDSRKITYILENDATFCIWDGIIISITDPLDQTLKIGENATGIYVSVTYASDGASFDGLCPLNNTQFSYDMPGKRGYTVESVSGGARNISFILMNDATFAVWSREPTTLHIDSQSSEVLISTIYDPTGFVFEVWLTNSSEDMISGWVDLSIGGEDHSLYCAGDTKTEFIYYPTSVGTFSLTATYEGDSLYTASEEQVTDLHSLRRGVTCDATTPSPMLATRDELLMIFDVFDDDFQGTYGGVTYINDYPINATYEVWWTLSSAYTGPFTYVGSWSISQGEGESSWSVPWDLDGDGELTEDDLKVYVVISINGLGTYENATIHLPVEVIHELSIDIQPSMVRYSDLATITVELTPKHASTGDLDMSHEVTLFMSEDNKTWISYDTKNANESGVVKFHWLCDAMGAQYFKAQADGSSYFIECEGYSNIAPLKELTLLEIVDARNFTYSDQGVIIGRFTTDDGAPLDNRPVFLELWDEGWISVGSGITNTTGHVNLLWTPELKPALYTIQIRATLTDSQYFESPETVAGQVLVGKEILVVSIDLSLVNDGIVRVQVTDDENTTLQGLTVTLYHENSTIRYEAITNSDGYATFSLAIEEGESIRVTVAETDFYLSASANAIVSNPPDPMAFFSSIGILASIGLPVVFGISILRKRRNMPKVATPATPEELRAEDEVLEEGFEETRSEYRAILDGRTRPESVEASRKGVEGDDIE